MKRVMVPVSTDVSDTGYVGVSYIHWNASAKASSATAEKICPLMLVHGFDSSSLEYRRLGPKLAALGVDVYCVDLLGWGYTQLDGVKSFSAQAKVDALKGFWETVGKNEQVVVGGASLGGAAVIEFASQNLYRSGETTDESVGDDDYNDSGFVKGTILIDAQGFVDGIGPMSFLPSPLAKLGIQVLKSTPLRESANQMSYHDPTTFATQDALNVGRLHCLREGWEESMLSFMQSGGFRPATKVGQITVPSLVLWGRQDGILKGEEFANKFVETLPDGELRWIEECGHVPHLEKPDETAALIREFLDKVKPERREGVGGIFDGLLSLMK
jgi:pimeloyl-ACP methyl ester carboxylesterase